MNSVSRSIQYGIRHDLGQSSAFDWLTSNALVWPRLLEQDTRWSPVSPGPQHHPVETCRGVRHRQRGSTPSPCSKVQLNSFQSQASNASRRSLPGTPLRFQDLLGKSCQRVTMSTLLQNRGYRKSGPSLVSFVSILPRPYSLRSPPIKVTQCTFSLQRP